MELPKRPEEMALSRQFGMKLLERRRLVELSQIRTAERAGMHPSEIDLLERGLRLPRLDTIVSQKEPKTIGEMFGSNLPAAAGR